MKKAQQLLGFVVQGKVGSVQRRQAAIQCGVERQAALYEHHPSRFVTAINVKELRFRLTGLHVTVRRAAHRMNVQLIDNHCETLLRHCILQ
ncbi:hypothetical protein [Cupriavidus necator]